MPLILRIPNLRVELVVFLVREGGGVAEKIASGRLVLCLACLKFYSWVEKVGRCNISRGLLRDVLRDGQRPIPGFGPRNSGTERSNG